MERWSGKVAVVTGAHSELGQAILRALAKHGMKVVGLDRDEDKLRTLVITIKGKIHTFKCDGKSERSIVTAFRKIEEHLGGVDLLVNAAECSSSSATLDGSTADWKDILETNILGVSICTREALKSMKARGDDGNIVNINSTLSQSLNSPFYESSGMYAVSKNAVTALSETQRRELRKIGSNIKITCIHHGWIYTNSDEGVETCLFGKSDDCDPDDIPDGYISAQDVAKAVIAAISVQSYVEIQELTVQSSRFF